MKRLYVYLFVSFLLIPLSAQQYNVDTSFRIEDLVNDILLQNKECLDVWNIEYTGTLHSIGYFSTTSGALPLKNGIVLSTGHVINTKGPNLDAGESTSNNYPGDHNLDQIAQGITYDAAVLEFDFITSADSICFAYFFGSEEYPEYVNDNVDDVFGFFIETRSGEKSQNIAEIPNSHVTVSIDNINAGNNSEYFTPNNLYIARDHQYYYNDEQAYERSLLFELDGFTSLLYAGYRTIPGKAYHLKIAIADVGDDLFDSGVFLGESSFRIAGVMKSADNSLLQILNKIPQQEIVDVNEDSTMASISVSVPFEFNSYEIPSAYLEFLDKLIEIMKIHPEYSMELVGHTDDIGSENYNMELSDKRAGAIANYLMGKGINETRITHYGMGNKNPVTTQKTETARARNRRVGFVMHKK